MIGACQWCLCLAFVLHAGSIHGSLNGATSRSAEKATVRLYNYARVPAETLSAARRHATEVFRAAGIDLAWMDCPISYEDAAKSHRCPGNTDPATFLLRIVAAAPSSMEKGSLGSGVFGVSSDLTAVIFFERVQRFADGPDPPLWLLLGTVLVGRPRLLFTPQQATQMRAQSFGHK
jgi:hypothetical protein